MLKVNEIFGPTIQGEGPSMGKEVAFIRLALCNLYCSFCDTPYTWNWQGTRFSHPEKYEKEKEIHLMKPETIVADILKRGVKAIVISGGEPLVQTKDLIALCTLLKQEGLWIEIETNGTILPSFDLVELVDQFNCSPKLKNSHVKWEQRFKPAILRWLATNHKVFFKFVVGSEEDVREIVEFYDKFLSIQCSDQERIYLMPLGKTREELALTSPLVEGLAKSRSLQYSPRRHIELYGSRRGV